MLQERAAGSIGAAGFAPLAPAHAEWFKAVKTKQAAVPMHYGTKVPLDGNCTCGTKHAFNSASLIPVAPWLVCVLRR